MTVQNPRSEHGAGCETRVDAAGEDVLVFPASFAQRQLWFLDQYEPDSALYSIPLALRLRGELNKSALEQSLCELVRRHEVLRTTFDLVDGQPVQLVHPVLNHLLAEENLVHLDCEEREARLEKLLKQDARKTFDLKRGPLFRSKLFLLAKEEYVLLLTMHHIVSDGWSMGVLFRDLSALYEAFCKSEAPSLPELPIQYADFATWQQERLQGEFLQDQLSYWKEHLKKDLPVLQLSTDRPRPAIQTHRGAEKSFVLPEALLEFLKALGRQEGSTLFMVLLAAFNALLYRHSGQEDIVVGTPIAGRSRTEVEGLVGFFANTLALRADLAGEPTFRELLQRTREACLGAYTHQDLPFERLVQELNPERNRGHAPLFQVMFVLQSASSAELRMAGLEISVLHIELETAKFDVTLSMEESSEELGGVIGYCTDLFDATTIEQMIGHFRVLLEGIVAAPDTPISKLPLLAKDDLQRLLTTWKGPSINYPEDLCVHQLFEAQVERSPDVEAVVFEDQRLSYRDLNTRANRLAFRLRRLGVGPEVMVGICLERSLDMVLGLLAVLKAGGAYLPLDPSYPHERLTFMLSDSGAKVLITQRRYLMSPAAEEITTVCLDEDQKYEESDFPCNPSSGAKGENAVYVLYTSGSTGQPKGVVIEHRQLRNYVEAIVDRLGLQTGASFAMVQPFSVDSCHTTIFPALGWGGTLHIVSRDCALDAAALSAYFVRYRIDCLKIAPSHLAALLAAGDARALLPHRCLVIGGEASNWSFADRLLALAKTECAIWNHYGPTEATVGVLTYPIVPDKNEHLRTTSSVPLGRPLANVRVYVLDGHGNLLPAGIAGELFIGGTAIARGYLHRPGLTAERFLPDPFSEVPGARMYRTGDRARCLLDGNIEFLGRMDDQVKIRGFRVELGEIEATLCEHPAVSSSVVVCLNDRPDDIRLVAYVAPKTRQILVGKELREFLVGRLPHYMVPSDFVLLEVLPRTPHGKVDLRGLPAPGASPPQMIETYAAPRTGVEETLARIWAEVLKVDRVSVSDNFFDLGGHSLLAVAMFAQIKAAFGKQLPLATLFDAPTIEHLAAALCDVNWQAGSVLVPIQPNGSRPPLFCVHPADGEVMLYRDLAFHLGNDQPVFGLQSMGTDGSMRPPTTVEEMAARYVREMKTVQHHGPWCLAGYCLGAFVALEIARKLQEQGETVGLLAVINTSGQWRMVGSAGQAIAYHWHNLSLLGPGGKARYLSARARYRMMRIQNEAAISICRFRLAARRALPPGLLRRYVTELNHRAGEAYHPGTYRGRLVYFQGSRDAHQNPRPFWSGIASEGVDVITVPGGNIDVLKEPDVQGLADHLRSCLDQAYHKNR